MNTEPGFFEIPRVSPDTPFEDLDRDYFRPEMPVIIEGAGRDWPALKKWSLAYLQEKLSDEPSLKHIAYFLVLDSDALADDAAYPEFIERFNDPARIFPYPSNARIWINSKNNVSAWHYDTGVVNNFNTQIIGRKEWLLVSPQTPPDCYPFSNIVVLSDDGRILQDTIYTRCITRPGDMLYLPPLWYHAVKALDESNINLMWVFTKRRADVISPALARDEFRYRAHRYLLSHRFPWVRHAYARLRPRLPGWLKVVWHYDQLIETGIPRTRWGGVRWLLRELAMLGRTVATIPRLRRQSRRAEMAPRLSGATPDRDGAGYG